MPRKKLSILIPSYNRSVCLQKLLETLESELIEIESSVGIVVSDNGSTDKTQEVTDAFQKRLPNLRIIRHNQNIGMDENFCSCIEADDSEFFWMMGDDDLPRAGAIRYVLKLIDRETPDLIYMESNWRVELYDNQVMGPLPRVSALQLVRENFANRVNIWMTFISGMVIRRASFVDGAKPKDLRKYDKTNLMQLAWVLGTLQHGEKFLYIPEACILATSGNTGDYMVLKVFAEYFPNIVNKQFGEKSKIARSINLRSALGYLPKLVWKVRTGQVGKFTKDQSSGANIQLEKAGLLNSFIVKRIGSGSRIEAYAIRAACAALARTLYLFDCLLEVFDRALKHFIKSVKIIER